MHRLIHYTSLVITLALGIIAHAQTTTFDFYIDTKATEGVGKPYDNKDGFYYFIGGQKDTLTVDMYNNIMLLKINHTGDIIISKIDYSPDTSIGLGHLIKTDNDFLGIGSYDFNDSSHGGMYNITFDTNLDILSKRTIGFPTGYYTYLSSAKHILKDKDANYIYVVSLSEPYNNQGFDAGDICFYKYNESGDTIKTSILKMDNGQHVDDVCFNADTSEIWLFGSGFQDGVHQWVKFDMGFNHISTEEFYLKADYPFHILKENVNSWLGCGSFSVLDRLQNDDLWVFRMDSLGNILNETNLGTPDTIDYAAFGTAIAINEYGDIYVSGTHNIIIGAFPNTTSWVMLTKLDNNFEHKFTRYYNADNLYYINIDVNICNDGGIILSNQRYDYYNDDVPKNWDAWVLKVDGNGYMTGQGDKPYSETKNALIYPNPGGDQFQVTCGWPSAVIHLYNMNGQLVLMKKLTTLTTTVDTPSLPLGNYVWTITINKNTVIEKGKWIKTK